MNDLIVVMGASEEHGMMNLYLRQLASGGIEYVVVDGSDKPNINGGGNLGYRVKKFREVASLYQHYERMIISDAFDMLFYGTKEQVLSKIPTDYVLHAAEKNCYPNESLALPIPDRGPWKYANGGFVAGTPSQILGWCSEVEHHPLYQPNSLDQHFLNILTSEGSPHGVIDYETNLCFCLYGSYPELEFERGLPINTLYGTRPSFIHANGKWDATEMFAKYERSLL